MQVSVITPTVGTSALTEAVRSVAAQTHPVRHVVVVDGAVHETAAREAIDAAGLSAAHAPVVLVLPDNTGHDRNNGHRIYRHVAPLLDTDLVALLDEDNTYESDHVATLAPIAQVHGAAWSLRHLVTAAGEDLGIDHVESIGRPVGPDHARYVLVDTSCWMVRRDLVGLLAAIDRPWDGDRQLTATLAKHVGDLARLCTGRATVRYRVPQRLVAAFSVALAQRSRTRSGKPGDAAP
jgi:glycosyltransferase involved in cell wall biosynthesis